MSILPDIYGFWLAYPSLQPIAGPTPGQLAGSINPLRMKKPSKENVNQLAAEDGVSGSNAFGFSPPGFTPQESQTTYPLPLQTLPIANKEQSDLPIQMNQDSGSTEYNQSDEPVQMVIGNGDKANIGRLAFDRDYVIAKITGTTKASFMPGANWSSVPIIYNLQYFNNQKGGMALGSDPNYWLVKKSDEAQFKQNYSKRTSTLIPLRSAVLQGLATGTFVLDPKTNKIKPGNGGSYADGTYPFVILADKTLLIANSPSVGHTGLAKGNAVMMAGELSIKGEKATYKSCQTGHYYTTPSEEARGLDVMKARYRWIGDLQQKGLETKVGTGLAALGMVVSGGTYGHLTTMKKNFLAAKKLWDKYKTYWFVDGMMQGLKNQIVNYQREDDEEVKSKAGQAAKIKQLTRIVAVTTEMLHDMEEGIKEYLQDGDNEPAPKQLVRYDGDDPFEDSDDEDY